MEGRSAVHSLTFCSYHQEAEALHPKCPQVLWRLFHKRGPWYSKAASPMKCYNSSNPAAVNATLVYDFRVHQGHFWIRSIEDVQDQPLPHCSLTSLPHERQCTVCLDEVVYAVCRELKDDVVLTMEALQHPIKISKSDCPKLLSDAAPLWPLHVAVALLMLVLIIFGVCFYRRLVRKPKKQTREETQTPQEAEQIPLNDVQQAAPPAASS